jgi:isorenieratene synthase
VALAGDGIRVPLPCALMERAAVSGVLASNALLAPFGVAAEPIRSVPSRGLFARRGRALPARVPESVPESVRMAAPASVSELLPRWNDAEPSVRSPR